MKLGQQCCSMVVILFLVCCCALTFSLPSAFNFPDKAQKGQSGNNDDDALFDLSVLRRQQPEAAREATTSAVDDFTEAESVRDEVANTDYAVNEFTRGINDFTQDLLREVQHKGR